MAVSQDLSKLYRTEASFLRAMAQTFEIRKLRPRGNGVSPKEAQNLLHLFSVLLRATIEETYSKAMAKLSKLASNGTPMG